MKETLLSAHIDSDDELIAITRKACYQFKQKLKEPKKLLEKLAKTQEIDTQYWEVIWEYSGVGASH